FGSWSANCRRSSGCAVRSRTASRQRRRKTGRHASRRTGDVVRVSTQQDRMRIDQSHPAELSAEELAVRAKSGPEPSAMAAYSQLVDRYHARLYSFLLRRLPAADAEDLTQEAFIRAWQRIETYNPRYR